MGKGVQDLYSAHTSRHPGRSAGDDSLSLIIVVMAKLGYGGRIPPDMPQSNHDRDAIIAAGVIQSERRITGGGQGRAEANNTNQHQCYWVAVTHGAHITYMAAITVRPQAKKIVTTTAWLSASFETTSDVGSISYIHPTSTRIIGPMRFAGEAQISDCFCCTAMCHWSLT